MSLAALDLTPSPLEQLRRLAAQRDDYIDLSSSNPTHHGFIFPTDILRDASEEYWRTRRYEPHPKGSLRAREAIARYYARREPPLDISPEHIFITASTNEAYSLLFALLTQPGDNVLAPIPSYPLFSHLAAMNHIELRNYWLDIVGAQSEFSLHTLQWAVDGARLTEQMDECTRAVMLISPHNPTGHVITETLRLPTSNLPIIADEVFCEFPFAARSVPPIGTLHPDATVFHLNGISKMFALPDLKLGWIAISGPSADDYIEPLELLSDTLLGANSLTQFMLPTLFERGRPFVEQMRARIQSNLLVALAHLHNINWVRVAPPFGGTYLFPEVVDCHAEDLLLADMLEAGLFAHPGYFYDEERGCFLMLSALVETPKLIEGLTRLERVLDVDW